MSICASSFKANRNYGKPAAVTRTHSVKKAENRLVLQPVHSSDALGRCYKDDCCCRQKYQRDTSQRGHASNEGSEACDKQESHACHVVANADQG